MILYDDTFFLKEQILSLEKESKQQAAYIKLLEAECHAAHGVIDRRDEMSSYFDARDACDKYREQK